MDKRILAVVTVDKAKVNGGAPIFFAQDSKEAATMSEIIARIFGAAVHDLHNDVFIIVRH